MERVAVSDCFNPQADLKGKKAEEGKSIGFQKKPNIVRFMEENLKEKTNRRQLNGRLAKHEIETSSRFSSQVDHSEREEEPGSLSDSCEDEGFVEGPDEPFLGKTEHALFTSDHDVNEDNSFHRLSENLPKWNVPLKENIEASGLYASSIEEKNLIGDVIKGEKLKQAIAATIREIESGGDVAKEEMMMHDHISNVNQKNSLQQFADIKAMDSKQNEHAMPFKGSSSVSRMGPSLPEEPPVCESDMSSSGSLHKECPSILSAKSQSDVTLTDNSGYKTSEELQQIRIKFLRLVNRLGFSDHNVLVAQVLYRIGLAEQLKGGNTFNRNNAFNYDYATAIANDLEATAQRELNFTCTILLLGKSGVGKSATINSIFGEVKTQTNAFSYGTKHVKEITGTVHGVKLKIIDTPGLLPSASDRQRNEKMLLSVKRFMKRSPPDIVLYFDRLDMHTSDQGDVPLLRSISAVFGLPIWFNAIVVLTHASSAPPDGPNGVSLSYELFVLDRFSVVQQMIRQAAGDMRLINPTSLVENHPACRTNRSGLQVLPNGQVWKPQFLLLCFASKVLAEANSLLKFPKDVSAVIPCSGHAKVPPLPYLLSSLLQSRLHLEEHGTESDEVGNASDDELEYDDLPPFRRLTQEEIDCLGKRNRKLYLEELELREKLFLKKQWKEETRRRKELLQKMAFAQEDDLQSNTNIDDQRPSNTAIATPLHERVLPPTFDSGNPVHRYRYLDSRTTQWIDIDKTHGWDPDSGYDGIDLERTFEIARNIPISISGQVVKDKETNVTMECSTSLKHGKGQATFAGLDVQTIGEDMMYNLRTESCVSNFKQSKVLAGFALTVLGGMVVAGLKLESRVLTWRRLKLVMNGGALTGRGDITYGGTLEATIIDKEFEPHVSTLGLSIMSWHGDLAVGGNILSQFVLGKTMMIARASMNNRSAGQLSIKASSSEQIQMAHIAIVPILWALLSKHFFS